MEFVVDVQGFKRPVNDFVFKEVAMVRLQEDSLQSVYLFQPPSNWDYLPAKYKSENRWLENNYHGIPWSSDDICYDEVATSIQNVLRDARKVYVKGREKKKWLMGLTMTYNIYDLEEFGCPALQKLQEATTINTVCSHHTSIWVPICAVHNAKIMKQ